MKKGCLIIISVIALVILILFLISRISINRTDEKLEQIAKAIYKYKKHDFKETDKWDKFILLPYVENEEKNGLTFTWYYLLESGDTAKTFIEISKKKRLLYNEEPLAIYYNYKHSYIFDYDKDIINILPKKYHLSEEYKNNLKLSENQENNLMKNDGLTMLLEPTKLYSFLEDGFYSVLWRYDDYTSVSFFEPIANLTLCGQIKPTSEAKIIFTDSSEVLIIPYIASDKEMQNYNRE